MLGNPGGGKTTLLRHLALTHAQRIWHDGVKSIADGARVPILVRVAEYADSDAWRRASLTDYLADYHRVADCPAGDLGDLFTRELAAGHCLLLLDGLDEIARTDERIAVVRRIEEFVRRHTRVGNSFVVTSREEGYRAAALGGGFTHVRAGDMTREQVEQFLKRWCRAVEDAETPELPEPQRQAVADREIAGILAAVDGNPGVARLAVNPLMMRVLALIHRTGAQLPQKRIALYKLAAETLTRTWRLAQGVSESALARPEHVTRLLAVLAHWMHVNRPSGIATEAEVLAVLGKEWARITGLSWDPDDMPLTVETEVRAFLKRVRIQTGLFVERAPGRYSFLHLTFEEYFAGEVVPGLLELVAPDSFVQVQAASALGDAADQPEARPRLEELVENVGLNRIAEDLHKIIRSDAPSGLRASALSVLGLLCRWSPHVLDRVFDALRDDDWYVRYAAAQNLAEVGQSSDELRAAVREALLGVLTQSEPGGGDEDEQGTTADSAYKALWALEVATPDYREGEVL